MNEYGETVVVIFTPSSTVVAIAMGALLAACGLFGLAYGHVPSAGLVVAGAGLLAFAASLKQRLS